MGMGFLGFFRVLGFHWPIPGIFPNWVRSIGRSLEYSPTGCAPLADPWNIPRLCVFYCPIPGIFPDWVCSIGHSLEYFQPRAFYWLIPGIFPNRVGFID